MDFKSSNYSLFFGIRFSLFSFRLLSVKNVFMNFALKKFEDNNEKSCSWFRNRVSHKIDFKAVWSRNGHADSVGVNLWELLNKRFKNLSYEWSPKNMFASYNKRLVQISKFSLIPEPAFVFWFFRPFFSCTVFRPSSNRSRIEAKFSYIKISFKFHLSALRTENSLNSI